MDTELGCGFCQRNGLPVFLARPAIMDKSDGLPRLHPSYHASMPVGEAGAAMYTARILREGFLYVYYEKSNQWESYTIDSEGHYYLHPDTGGSPQCLNSDRKTVCMDNPSKVARASFITVYIMPRQENGVVWFAWSDAPWSEEIKKQHENKEHRIKNMQNFDVDAWLRNDLNNIKNATFLSEIKSTIAEFNKNYNKIYHRENIRIPKVFDAKKLFKDIKVNYSDFNAEIEEKADNIINEANQIFDNKGAIIFLSDPVGILKEISLLCNYLIKDKFPSDPKHARGLALSSMLSGLKQNICNQKRADIEEVNVSYEQNILKSNDNQWLQERGMKHNFKRRSNAEIEESVKKKREENIKTLDEKVDKFWNENYEKYIDRDKEKTFLENYNNDLFIYMEDIISPMIDMHLDWLESDEIKSRFMLNYNQNDNVCSLMYVQAVTDCINGMTDKKEITDFLFDKLQQEKINIDNYILRALVGNNNTLIQQINVEVSFATDYASLPWNKIFDGISDSIGQLGPLMEKIEVYVSKMASVFLHLVNKFIDHSPKPVLAVLIVKDGRKIEKILFEGTERELNKAMTKRIAEITSMGDQESMRKMERYTSRRMKELRIVDSKMDKKITREFNVLIDITQAEKIDNLPLPRDAKIRESALVITTGDELRKRVFDGKPYKKFNDAVIGVERALTNERSGIVASYNNERVQKKLNDTQFRGVTSSFIFQAYALATTFDGRSKSFENKTKYYANAIGAIGTLADGLETIFQKWGNHRYIANLPLNLGTATSLKVYTKAFGWISRGCAFAAVVGAVWDIYHGIDEIINRDISDRKLATAYLVSGVTSLVLVGVAIKWQLLLTLLGPMGIIICTLAFFGSAIYILTQDKDKIQKWLLACQWRKIPEGETGVPHMWADGLQEAKAYESDVLR
ncbi:hypothetical protein J8V57_16305 [Xenorhabdus sp. PB61.4]|uniref:T6SS effector BTH_I2691 family protein n=1 Tax=Xenorhabdus sp. PB61.4 TaxID=2788940 RepID=UPI001E652B9A|nr:T6SS effector BTH_I2691 family protein [Xenorhabdus sp. PB61.4]MCC8367813.1 hypothetical protein [Xenorhabdus sp. PB61.4]